MNELEKRIQALEGILGRGNFQSTSVQQKNAVFNGGFSLVNRTALPASCSIGDLAMKNGTLNVCTAVNTWTPTGSAGTFGGNVDITASSAQLPTGWIVGLAGHVYTVTHNLGTSSYAVVATAIGTTANIMAEAISRNNNTFTIQWGTVASVTGDTAWSFTLTLI